MKKHTKYIPISTFAAAIVLGSSLSGAESNSTATSSVNQQNPANIRGIGASTNARTGHQAKAHPMKASDILGMNIDTPNNEKIGEIDEILINSKTGEINGIVVSTGGFLGMGENQTLISPEDLRFNADRTGLKADLSKEQIRTAPRYQEGDNRQLGRNRAENESQSEWDSLNEGLADVKTQSTDYSENQADRTERLGSKETDNQRMNRNQSNQMQGEAVLLSDLVNKDVENRQGEDVGEVEEVFVDIENRKVAGVLISTGSVLGMGGQESLFGLNELSFKGNDDDALVLNYDSNQISGFPKYDSNDSAAFSNLDQRTNRLSGNINRSVKSEDARANADRNEYGQSNNNSYNSSNRDSNRGVNQSERDSNNANRDPYTRNERADESNNTDNASSMTVFNQGNSSEEIAMTASIREAILEDKSLSSRANNVTIMTKDEKVVLRGSVDSASEKSSVEKIAHNKAGRRNVTSELTVNTRLGGLSQ